MKKIKYIFLLFVSSSILASNIQKGYEALSIYDYFKAKQLFYKTLKKFPAAGSFGLANIYVRTDNPFSNIDSAAKYIASCRLHFIDTITYSDFHINKNSISVLAEKISVKGFDKYHLLHSINSYNTFLQHYDFASDELKLSCYTIRDSLIYKGYSAYQISDSITVFLLNYPQTELYKQATLDFFNLQYKEKSNPSDSKILKLFLKNYSNNPHKIEAEISLFELTKQLHQADSLYQFIEKYSTTQTKEQAWKSLYSLSVKNYSKEELSHFLNQYPDYPYNETLIKEISLAQQLLMPCKNTDEKYGYIDTLGHWIIKPQFDDANIFSEGFAAVCKNDSCFYINKEGVKTSDFYFEETENYINGIAIIKKENKFYLVNRSEQLISKGYEDINESSDNLFVCKLKNNYGAINAKGETIIPFTYSKLGNFKNGFAYYLSTHYGLVSTTNIALKAQWDWISDVDTNNIVLVKTNNKYGLMRVDETIVLAPTFDYVTYCQNGIYLVVKNGLYGFYNASELCFITAIEYDYNAAYETNYYTNGKYFKLVLDEEVALVDVNGRYSINFGTYSNVFFAKCDIIRIQKNAKYGFIDRKLKAITPTDFEQATDFDNNVAIVSKTGKAQLINKEGNPIFSMKDGKIEKLDSRLYKDIIGDIIGIIDEKGIRILPNNFISIEKINTNFYRLTTSDNSLHLFNSLTKTLVKL